MPYIFRYFTDQKLNRAQAKTFIEQAVRKSVSIKRKQYSSQMNLVGK